MKKSRNKELEEIKELTSKELEEIRGDNEWVYGKNHTSDRTFEIGKKPVKLVFKCDSCNKYFKSLQNCDKCGSDDLRFSYIGLPVDRAYAAFICTKCPTEPVSKSWICPECGLENPLFSTVQWPKKSCFIATAVYGTPMSDEVVILRQFRDNYLLRHKVGKIFVKYYYEHSPHLANLISEYKILRFFVRYAILKPALFAVRLFY